MSRKQKASTPARQENRGAPGGCGLVEWSEHEPLIGLDRLALTWCDRCAAAHQLDSPCSRFSNRAPRAAVAGVLIVALAFSSGCAPSRPWGRCALLGAIAGASIGSLGAVTGAYIADSSLDLPAKARAGEPLPEVFKHHVDTTNAVMLWAGLAGLGLGAALGALAGHYYCDAETGK
jgi:hypothetical protein